MPFDIQGFHLPLTAFVARCVREGVLPLWDPLSYCGVPIHADVQAQLFYPFTWIAILLANLSKGQKLFYWLEWMSPVHMMLGACFTYLLLRKLKCSVWVSFFGATVYQIGPFFVSQNEHLGAICSAAWFPLTTLCVIELAERFTKKWIALLAVSVAMGFLSGFPATLLVIITIGGVLSVALVVARQANWRLLVSYAAGCVLGFAIAGAQLLPTIQLSRLSVASLRWQWAGNGGGVHPKALASFFWPNYYHIFSPFDHARYRLPYDATTMYTYCGHLALLLILAAPFFLRRAKMLMISWALFAISLWWMLGEHAPLYTFLFRQLPHFVQGATYAGYALLGFSLFAAIVAALVLSRLQSKIPALLFALIVVANSWNLIAIGNNRFFSTADGGWRTATRDWIDGGYPVLRSLVKWSGVTQPPLRTDYLPGYYLELRTENEIVPLSSADGDNPFMPLRYYYLRRIFSDGVPWDREQLLNRADSPWPRALNVGFVIGGNPVTDFPKGMPDGLEPLPFDNVHGYRITNPLPRFYLAKHVRPVADEAEALKVVKEIGFNPLEETVVESPRESTVAAPSTEQPTVRVVSYENNRIELEVKSPIPSFLVSSDTVYPGWKATVNGRDTSILPTNVAFRGLRLRAGENRIVMTYFPTLMIVGLVISALAVSGTAWLLVAER